MPSYFHVYISIFMTSLLQLHVPHLWVHVCNCVDCTMFVKLSHVAPPQAHESLISGHFPAHEDTLRHLAALRLQYLHGDAIAVSWNLESVYPLKRIHNRILHFTRGRGGAGGTLEKRRSSFLEGLKAGGSLRKQRSVQDEQTMMDMWVKEETEGTRASIREKWNRLKGLDQQRAMIKYMDIVLQWSGYASALFDVEVSCSMIFNLLSCLWH